MARIRTIKPEFFSHYDLYQLEKNTGLPVRVAYAGLWTQADREGRFKWIPPQLKLGCLPYDDIDFSRVLDALATCDFIRKYEVKGAIFGVIPSFKDNQVINNREKDSDLPEPTEFIDVRRDDHASSTREVHAQAEGKGKEGKGKEGNKILPSEKSSVDDSEKPKPKKYKFTDDHHELAVRMSNPVKARFPGQQINLDEWADAVRKLIELDNRKREEIIALWHWVVNHASRNGFTWADNCRTPMKLRERKDGLQYFEIIAKQMQNETTCGEIAKFSAGNKPKSTRDMSLEEEADRSWAT